MMLDRRSTHSRLAAATLRRIATPSLVAALPVEHADHRPSI
jgi:hypothetical protein